MEIALRKEIIFICTKLVAMLNYIFKSYCRIENVCTQVGKS